MRGCGADFWDEPYAQKTCMGKLYRARGTKGKLRNFSSHPRRKKQNAPWMGHAEDDCENLCRAALIRSRMRILWGRAHLFMKVRTRMKRA